MVSVNACVVAYAPADRQKMRTGRGRIVQVMHSLRLVISVSHTVAPMHSLPTRSHYKNKAPLAHEEERGERGNGEGVAACTASVPSRGEQTVDIVCRC